MEDLLNSMFKEVDGIMEPVPAQRLSETVRQIIARDDRQVQGTKVRILARKELAYVYYMADNVLHTGLTSEQKPGRMKSKVGLPEEWEPDELIEKAIEEAKFDSVTMQDRMIATSRRLAEMHLSMLNEMINNSERLIIFFSTKVDDLTDEALATRTTQIKSAKEDLLKLQDTFSNIKKSIKDMDELVADRVVRDNAVRRKQSSLENPKHPSYQRKPDNDEDYNLDE